MGESGSGYGGLGGAQAVPTDDYARVDIQGIIYIFKYPDPTKLGSGTAGQDDGGPRRPRQMW